jgi:hypothetical protein
MREVEHLVEWKFVGNAEVPEHLPHCHSDHHKSRVNYLGLNPDTHCEKPELWYGPLQRKSINMYDQHGHEIFVPVEISQSV